MDPAGYEPKVGAEDPVDSNLRVLGEAVVADPRLAGSAKPSRRRILFAAVFLALCGMAALQFYVPARIQVAFREGVSRRDAEITLVKYGLLHDAVNVNEFGGSRYCTIKAGSWVLSDPIELAGKIDAESLFEYPFSAGITGDSADPAQLSRRLYGDGIKVKAMYSSYGEKIRAFDEATHEIEISCEGWQPGYFVFNSVSVIPGMEPYWRLRLAAEPGVQYADPPSFPTGGRDY